MLSFKLTALPFHDKPIGEGGMLAAIWNRWLQALADRVSKCLWIVSSTALTAQSAAISATALAPALPVGTYRVEYYLRVTQAASTSSSVTFTTNWTDGGVAQSYSWAALTGNTTASAQSAATILHVDAGSQVTYETAYSSTGATSMQYMLTAILYRAGEL